MFARIAACRSWPALRDLYQHEAPLLEPAHIPSFMSAAVKVLAVPPVAVGSSGRGALARADLDGSERRQVVAFVQQLASSALRLARASELAPRGLATALWAVGKLASRTGSSACAWGSAWALDMLLCFRPHLSAFGPQDLSQAVWAAATLGCQPPPGFLAAALTVSRPRLASFGPQALSNMLWALAHMRFQPPPSWIDAALAASLPQLCAFSPQALAMTASALVAMDHAPPAKWQQAFLACCPAAWAPAPGPAAAAASPQAIVQTAWAVARLGMRPGAAWLASLESALATSACRFAGQDTAVAIWALGALRHRPLNARCEAELLAALARCVGGMPAPRLAACLTAFAHLRWAPPGPVLSALLEALAQQMPASGSQAAANALWGAARLGLRPPSAWLAACFGRFLACLDDEEDVGPQVRHCWL